MKNERNRLNITAGREGGGEKERKKERKEGRDARKKEDRSEHASWR